MKIIDIGIKQTKKGDDYKSCSLDNDRRFNIFQGHTRYEEMEVGTEIREDDLMRDGKFYNLKDVEAKPPAKPFWKPSGAKEGLAIKAENIKQAQDRSQASMTRLAIERDSSNFVIALIPTLYRDMLVDELQQKRNEWRKWLNDKYNEPFI